MSTRDIIVIGASAGGIEALSTIVRQLPADLPAALFVVVHFPGNATSVLPQILERAGRLPALHPSHGARIEPGRIYVAPPNYHLLLAEGHVHLWRGPKENGTRPAVDPLFRSAARTYGPRVVGVVLTGNLDDGSAGLAAIHRGGGVALVQDPSDASHPSMPTSALEAVPAAQRAPLGEIAHLLGQLVRSTVVAGEHPMNGTDDPLPLPPGNAPVPAAHSNPAPPAPAPNPPHPEVNAPYEAPDAHPPPGGGEFTEGATGFSCPECHGSLWEAYEGDVLQFRCRVGHLFSAETLLSEQSGMVEAALWSALNALEEQADLARRIARRMRARGSHQLEKRYQERSRETLQQAALIRRILERPAEETPDVAARAQRSA